jgi:type II secretory pathway pseudopilin PulG
MKAGFNAMKTNSYNRRATEAGFSVIEMFIVMAIVLIGATVALFYFNSHRALYESDDQSLRIVDLLQRARQMALTGRRTMRVEFNLTTNSVRLIDEGRDVTTTNDDVLVQELILRPTSTLQISQRPTNVTQAPPETSPCPDAVFAPGNYTFTGTANYGSPASSSGQNVFTIRFTRTGQVTDGGADGMGTNASMRGATVYVYPPLTGSPAQTSNLGLVRAITVQGVSGVIRFWEHSQSNSGGVNNSGWSDTRTRRTGS